jgi:hypothetical protein
MRLGVAKSLTRIGQINLAYWQNLMPMQSDRSKIGFLRISNMDMKKPYNFHWQNKIRHQFLLTFFDPENQYQEKEINGYFLIKQFNTLQKCWEVAIYTRSAYSKRKAHQNRVSDLLIPRRNKQKRG